jgi:hypothetical protein
MDSVNKHIPLKTIYVAQLTGLDDSWPTEQSRPPHPNSLRTRVVVCKLRHHPQPTAQHTHIGM